MKILAVGDVMGKPGRRAIKALLPALIADEKIDFTVVNGENSAGGTGITQETGREIFAAGADVITTGNHVWHQKDVDQYLIQEERVLRPANYPESLAGRGHVVVKAKNGRAVAVVNIQGRVFMPTIDCPFLKMQTLLPELRKQTDLIIVDIHAEATSEKVAMGRFLSGQISLLFGTHTHVQTADEKILRGGTAYITDLGMTGPHDSVIGMDGDIIVKKFLNQRPVRFEVASGDVRLHGVVVDVDESTGTAKSIKRIARMLPDEAGRS